jgi:hypothetical protein
LYFAKVHSASEWLAVYDQTALLQKLRNPKFSLGFLDFVGDCVYSAVNASPFKHPLFHVSFTFLLTKSCPAIPTPLLSLVL